jgi:Histone methylation protein DOT1
MIKELKDSLASEVFADIEAISKDGSLYLERNFNLRVQAIDDLEFHVIDRINASMESKDSTGQMEVLKHYAHQVKAQLEAVNTSMFNEIRKKISTGAYKGKLLLKLIDEYFDHRLNEFLQKETVGYDNLDVFVNGLFTHQSLPPETKEREPEMVYFQKTPARIILSFIKRAEFKAQDVFYDLGSGLGQVNMLVNVLTGVISKGVEFEPAFCHYATASAADLNLKDLDFINTDARYADYALGTIFFMYTPFEGEMLQEVLRVLQDESIHRKIKIYTYGPCGSELAKQDWLIKGFEIKDASGNCCEFLSR